MPYLSKYVKPIDYTNCVGELARIKERFRWRKEAAEYTATGVVIDLIAQDSQKEASNFYLYDLGYLLRLVDRLSE